MRDPARLLASIQSWRAARGTNVRICQSNRRQSQTVLSSGCPAPLARSYKSWTQCSASPAKATRRTLPNRARPPARLPSHVRLRRAVLQFASAYLCPDPRASEPDYHAGIRRRLPRKGIESSFRANDCEQAQKTALVRLALERLPRPTQPESTVQGAPRLISPGRVWKDDRVSSPHPVDRRSRPLWPLSFFASGTDV